MIDQFEGNSIDADIFNKIWGTNLTQDEIPRGVRFKYYRSEQELFLKTKGIPYKWSL